MFTIFKKELKVYFTSITGYILMFIFLLLSSFFYYGYFLSMQGSTNFSNFFIDVNTVFLFIIPILTFRILAEDKKLATFELLLTSPVSVWNIILGKFFAVLVFVVISASFLLIYPIILSLFAPIEWGSVFSGYLGLIFSVAFFISAGIFASSLTDNYVVAGIISFAIFLLLYIITFFTNISHPFFNVFLKELSYAEHYNQFTTGILNIKDILYFILGILFWLSLAKYITETKIWK